MTQKLRQQGRRAFLSGDYKAANELYEAFFKSGMDDMGAVLHLAICKEIVGDMPAAKKLYDDYLSREGGSHALKETIRGRALFRLHFPAAKDTHIEFDPKNAITMSRLLGWGRFGNQLFEYFYLYSHTQVHDLQLVLPYWLGRDLFRLEDPLLSNVKGFTERSEKQLPMSKGLISQKQGGTSFAGTNLKGFCQLDSAFYAPFQTSFRQLFTPIDPLKKQLERFWSQVKKESKTVIGVHLRRTDYIGSTLDVGDIKWVKDWLRERLNHHKGNALIYIASDDPKAVTELSEFPTVSMSDFDISIPGAEFLPDWWALQQVNELAIANSTFSITAAMLNTNAKVFVRPNNEQQSMIPLDPWNTVILDREA